MSYRSLKPSSHKRTSSLGSSSSSSSLLKPACDAVLFVPWRSCCDGLVCCEFLKLEACSLIFFTTKLKSRVTVFWNTGGPAFFDSLTQWRSIVSIALLKN
uniref:Uncharacterized protein n=1 Tax=Glossina pallidipes TaxID=7398 RepID=A0A1A9ZEU9_GLOPL